MLIQSGMSYVIPKYIVIKFAAQKLREVYKEMPDHRRPALPPELEIRQVYFL